MWRHRLCECHRRRKIRHVTQFTKFMISLAFLMFMHFSTVFMPAYYHEQESEVPRSCNEPCKFVKLIFQKNYKNSGKDVQDLFNIVKHYTPIPTNFNQIKRNFNFINNSTIQVTLKKTLKYFIRTASHSFGPRFCMTSAKWPKFYAPNSWYDISLRLNVLQILDYPIFLFE
uniref:Uncharacterized protein n=1 Tax=Panagrolaimus sp. PS1159 TaxID=55785 RepID=A0AC35GTL0_9BILA